MAGPEDEEEAPDFPPELDEFLEYCVAERGGDFEAISSDFLDIAAELEEPLAERAQEFFSPEALQQRWQLLSGEIADAPGAEEEPSLPASCEQPLAPAAPPAAPAAPPPAAGPAEEEAEEVEAPSGFSIFKDSLKDQIDKIYLDVQNNLPSAVGLGDEEEDSEEDSAGLDAASPSGASCPINLTRPPPGGGGGPEAAPPGAAPAAGGELPAGAALEGLELGGGELRQRTMELFGTDDLNQIFSGLAKGPAVSSDVPDFAAVLLSHGVNPQDIEGPLVQPPEIFRQLREGARGRGGRAGVQEDRGRRARRGRGAPGGRGLRGQRGQRGLRGGGLREDAAAREDLEPGDGQHVGGGRRPSQPHSRRLAACLPAAAPRGRAASGARARARAEGRGRGQEVCEAGARREQRWGGGGGGGAGAAGQQQRLHGPRGQAPRGRGRAGGGARAGALAPDAEGT